MQQFNGNYYIQNLQAKDRLEELHKEARQHRLLGLRQRVSWRRKFANRLIWIAGRLEPTLQPPTQVTPEMK